MNNKVLLVEDDENLSQLIVKYLKRKQIQVDAIMDVYSIDKLNPEDYSVIILDITLPGISGDIFLSMFNDLYLVDNETETDKVRYPFVFITTGLDKYNKKLVNLTESYPKLIIEIFFKPYNIKELVSKIEEVIYTS